MGLEVGALAAIGLIGGSVYQGQQAAQAQRRGLRSQERAQQQALARANAEVRRREQEQRKLNRKAPDIASLLASERALAGQGPASTLLTGSRGIDQRKLSLGATSLLGGL